MIVIAESDLNNHTEGDIVIHNGELVRVGDEFSNRNGDAEFTSWTLAPVADKDLTSVISFLMGEILRLESRVEALEQCNPMLYTMKTAIISDIHSNIDALNNVIADIEKNRCDQVVCLGDIVGYGYDPVSCIDRIAGLGCRYVVTGNHDAAVSGKLGLDWFNSVSRAGVVRDKEKITNSVGMVCRMQFLANLPTQVRDDGFRSIVYTHGDLDGGYEFPYIDDMWAANDTAKKMKSLCIDMLFVGHTHYANCYRYPKTKYGVLAPHLKETFIDTKNQNTSISLFGAPMPIIVNVGSVGYPRNQPFSCYCIYDGTNQKVTWRKLKFDFDSYCSKMKDAGIPIPQWMRRWVDEGLVDPKWCV